MRHAPTWLTDSKSLGKTRKPILAMIIFFSTSLSWRATVALLLVQLAFGLFQTSFQPYQVVLC